MKKYQLRWKVDILEPAACPDFKQDAYTGEYPPTMCAVAHFTKKTREMDKSFETLEEIETFKENAPKNCFDWETLEMSKLPSHLT